ncbi:non-homologous end-joining DNA ligase [Candidatus Dependentiae bacterium]|nr:non-homologous end-joining DNA ligase [Candidatus Dependentiae bacterium]
MKKNIFKGLLPEDLKKLKKIPQPDFVPPMLAVLTNKYFTSEDWIYEHKFDGQRCEVIKKNGKVVLMSRNKRKINDEYPELAQALEKQKADNFIIDGEIIALGKKGVSNFELLQSRINLKDILKIEQRKKAIPVIFQIFDIMYVSGYDTHELPLLIRKKILKKLLNYNKILIYSPHKSGNGLLYLKQACKKHWEGLIAKKADSIYTGRRSPTWLKFKCGMGQELVIGGYTKPKGSRTDLGALLVGYYKNGKLKYAGKVGTGYTQETLKMLGKKLRALEIKKCPFDGYDESTKDVHWVSPKLVADFKFANWTNEGKLRVGRYKGLRTDKAAKDVILELPNKMPS